MLRSLRVNLQRALGAKYSIGAYHYAIFRPGGNDTGLIYGVIKDPKQKKRIAAALQETYPSIEQVGFINNDLSHPELMMAGGEFCGNATRSAAYCILQGKPGKFMIRSSGAKNKLFAGVTNDGECFSQMPIFSDPSNVIPDKDNPGNALVKMEGITHYIDFDFNKIRGLTVEEIKDKARKEMARRGIDKEVCCGIMYVDQRKDWLAIHPIVYVRDVDTLFYETACGSGTTALGQVLALRQQKSIKELPILQPSGLSIKVSVEFNGKSFGYAQIQSAVDKLQEGVFEVAAERLHKPYIFSTSRRILHSLIRN